MGGGHYGEGGHYGGGWDPIGGTLGGGVRGYPKGMGTPGWGQGRPQGDGEAMGGSHFKGEKVTLTFSFSGILPVERTYNVELGN